MHFYKFNRTIVFICMSLITLMITAAVGFGFSSLELAIVVLCESVALNMIAWVFFIKPAFIKQEYLFNQKIESIRKQISDLKITTDETKRIAKSLKDFRPYETGRS